LRKVHTAESLVEVAHLQNLLQAAGIASYVRNERLAGAMGEIPFLECWPELWVVESGQSLRARGLIDEALRPSPASDDWQCPQCGETIEGQFALCWNCGAAPVTG
jgi:hypothetical protein